VATDYLLYTVKRGDTLWAISREYDVTVEQIKQLNGLTSNLIFPGQVLKIKEVEQTLDYVTHTVVKGDTLWAISRKYGVTVEQIKQLNGLTTNLIFPGQVFKIKKQTDTEGNVYHTVVKGDTLWAISRKYGVTVEHIKQLNGLTSNLIHPDQVLLIKENGENTAPSKLVSHGDLRQKQIALTFDAGGDIAGIKILEVLRKNGVQCTFFLTGTWVEKYPSYARQIVDDGHEVANHSYNHPNFTQLSYDEMLNQVRRAELEIIEVTAQNPRPYFRFPYGSSNSQALKAVGESGYSYSVHWTTDTLDWQQPEADVIANRIETNASNGDIVLMHIGGINTPEAVDKVIPRLKNVGFELVKISEILI
jgi:LysM repeat protein